MRNKLFGAVLSYGAPILQTDAFHAAMLQKHHLRSTVGLHSIRTAEAAVLLGRLFGEDQASLTKIALCHDLGIIGREKFHSPMECLKEHPVCSAEKAKELIPDITQKEQDAILTHMWPLCSMRPESGEGWILSAADKIASVWDILGRRENPDNSKVFANQTYFPCN